MATDGSVAGRLHGGKPPPLGRAVRRSAGTGAIGLVQAGAGPTATTIVRGRGRVCHRRCFRPGVEVERATAAGLSHTGRRVWDCCRASLAARHRPPAAPPGLATSRRRGGPCCSSKRTGRAADAGMLSRMEAAANWPRRHHCYAIPRGAVASSHGNKAQRVAACRAYSALKPQQ